MKKANLILTSLLALIMLAGCPGATEDNNGTGNAGGGQNGGNIVNPYANYPKWDVEVTNLTATPGNRSIRITWTEPTDPRLDSYWIVLNDGNASLPVQHGAGEPVKTFQNLENGREYTISIITLGVDESDEDNPKWYASTGVSVKATPTAAADNTVYLPSLTNFSASWDSAKECVILTWTDVTDSHAEGYYFFATTTNTRPAAPSYNENSFENLEGHSNRVGDNTISQESTELWINDENTPFKLQANTTYYIWALTEGTGDEDEYLYSKWDEMPMATVTTGSVSDNNNGNNGNTTYLPSATNLRAVYDAQEQCVNLNWDEITNTNNYDITYHIIVSLASSVSEPSKSGDYYNIDDLISNTIPFTSSGSNGEATFMIDTDPESGLLANKTYYFFILTQGKDEVTEDVFYSKWSEMPRVSVMTGNSSGGIAEGE